MAESQPSSVRIDGQDDDSRRGAAYQVILEHILTYPETYPLPTMPTPNTRTLQLQTEWRAPSTPDRRHIHPAQRSPISPPSPIEAANAQFVASLMDHIATLPSQPCSLPPAFITNFLRHCFPPELHLVDFPQALIGLTYLEDLERRRSREVSAGKRRLDISETALRQDPKYLSTLPIGVATWHHEMETAQRKLEALYTQIYVGLRRWIIINELSIAPLNKHNALAMLNTLFPHIDVNDPSPRAAPPPTIHLTPQVLQRQREAFLKYITAVETRGTSTLKPLMDKGKPSTAPEGITGWPYVAQGLDQYLRLAIRIIEDASCVTSRDDLELPSLTPPRPELTPEAQPKRKADSGVVVNPNSSALPNRERKISAASPSVNTRLSNSKSAGRPSTSSSGHTAGASSNPSNPSARSSTSTTSDKNKPLPHPPPGATVFTSAAAPGSAVKNFSRLEKIATEIRAFKMRRQASAQSHVSRASEEDDKENGPAPAQTNKHSRDGSAGNPIVLDDDSPSRPGTARSRTSTPMGNDGRGRTLRTLRSLGDLKNYTRAVSGSRTRSKSRGREESEKRAQGLAVEGMDVYDREEMLRQRALYQARTSPGH